MVDIQHNILTTKEKIDDVVHDWDVSLIETVFETFKCLETEKNEEKIWIIDETRSKKILYHQVETYTIAIASEFQKQGLGKNDVLAIISDNRVTLHTACFAAWLCGSSVSLHNPYSDINRTKEEIRLAGAKLIVCTPEVLEKTKKCVSEEKHPPTIILTDRTEGDESPYACLQDIFKISQNVISKTSFKDVRNYIALVLWSVGPEGKPKGIKFSQKMILSTLLGKVKFFDTNGTWVLGLWMFHYGGFFIPLTLALQNETAVYLQPDCINPQKIVESISTYDAQCGYFSYNDVVQLSNYTSKPNLDLSMVKVIISVGAKLPADCQGKLTKLFVNLKCCPDNYGASEAGCIFGSVSATSGKRVFPYVQLKIADLKTGESCPPDEHGEICVKTPLLTSGYLGCSSENIFDADGFYKTGDVGYYTQEKQLFITGRIKDLIKVGLHHVYSAEVESIIIKHPSVVAAGVCGVADPTEGEVCAAAVVLLPGSGPSEEDLIQWVNSQTKLETWKHVKKLRIYDQLPYKANEPKDSAKLRVLFDC